MAQGENAVLSSGVANLWAGTPTPTGAQSVRASSVLGWDPS